MRPLKLLLRKESDGAWTAECTAALNSLLRLASAQLRLQVVREGLPFRMYVSLDAETGGVLLGQGTPWRPVAMVGRELTSRERHSSYPE